MKNFSLPTLVLILTLGLGGAFFLISSEKTGNKQKLATQFEENAAETQNTATYLAATLSSKSPDADSLPNQVKYVNKKFDFSFIHAKEAVINEYEEGEGAMTLVMEERGGKKGFQVFIVPYQEATVSDERFKLDVPSGIRENETEVFLDQGQLKAVAFNSHDAFLGETLEVWFIREGYLYEITTLKNASEWLIPILNSWVFNS